MEEMHHIHKETAWGWIDALFSNRPTAAGKPRPKVVPKVAPCPPGGVVTPWDRHAPCGWSA